MMEKNAITVKYVRQKLGKKAERMTDKEVQNYIDSLRRLCTNAIDSVINDPKL